VKCEASVSIYNSLGKLIHTIGNVKFSKESNAVLFNAGNLEPGIYFYTLETSKFIISNKLIKK